MNNTRDSRIKDLRKLPIYHFRKEAGLTLDSLSAMSGVRANCISKYELGQSLPRIDAALALSKALSVPVEQLFAGAF